MFKYIIAISLLAGCLEDPFARDCNAAGKPSYPTVGGCVQTAPQGTAGGACLPGIYGSGDSCATGSGLQCIYGTCYECGKTNEPCCGDVAQADQGGSCLIGNCAPSSAADGWNTCQGDASTPPIEGCPPGSQANYYVWSLSSTCLGLRTAFCALDDAGAQAFVDANFGSIPHGAFSHDPDATRPLTWDVCGSGDGCTVVSDESQVTQLSAFDHSQLAACEAIYDSQCTWTDAVEHRCGL
jgi:hypothetical protein